MRSGFCVYDSRGFDYGRTREALEELSSWISEGVHHSQLCLRYRDSKMMTDDMENDDMGSSSKFVLRRVNCVILIANMAEIYQALKAGDLKPLEAIRQLFCCAALRKSICLTKYGFLEEECDPVSAYALTEVVYRALLISDRGQLPKKRFHHRALLILLCLVRFIGVCFALLADVCSKLGEKEKLRI
ncbi:uncharacterized protein LOC108458939 [Gossypium arboreum]|uniref:uncharacterized protein LOC108458939 n=1 Tax=Gossypium arboreum TaxID=29729 RepID=UPI0022F19541|nr:uncharacterized protein LOC108458939 [Gossypium arboreum]